MRACQQWRQDDYIEVEALVAALEGAAQALEIPVRIVRLDDDAKRVTRGASSKIARIEIESYSSFEDVRLDIRAPVEIRGTMVFDGYGLAFDPATVQGPWLPFYLFLAGTATLLGARPEAPRGEDDESSFAEDVRSWVEACVDDHLTERSIEPGPIPVAVGATPGAVGPLSLAWRREAAGVVLDVRGAGTDVRLTVGGRLLDLPDTEIAILLDEVRGDGLAESVVEERALVLGQTAPDPDPAHAGHVVLWVWVDGVRARAEVLDPALPVRGPIEQALREGIPDVVRYLDNGLPLLRWVATSLGERDETLADLEAWPTWRWCPSSLGEVNRVFWEITGRA